MCHGGFSGNIKGNLDIIRTHIISMVGAISIPFLHGRNRPASHAATDNIHTTRHSYVAIVVLEMQLIASYHILMYNKNA